MVAAHHERPSRTLAPPKAGASLFFGSEVRRHTGLGSIGGEPTRTTARPHPRRSRREVAGFPELTGDYVVRFRIVRSMQ